MNIPPPPPPNALVSPLSVVYHLTLEPRGIFWSLSLDKDFSPNSSIHKAQHQQNIELVTFPFVRVWKASQGFLRTASALELGLGNLTDK